MLLPLEERIFISIRISKVKAEFQSFGPYMRILAGLVACVLSAEHLALFEITKNENKCILTERKLRSPKLHVIRG